MWSSAFFATGEEAEKQAVGDRRPDRQKGDAGLGFGRGRACPGVADLKLTRLRQRRAGNHEAGGEQSETADG